MEFLPCPRAAKGQARSARFVGGVHWLAERVAVALGRVPGVVILAAKLRRLDVRA